MARRGENIYKRKDGRWEGRYVKGHIDGKIRYGYIYAKTYKEVKARLAEVLKNTARLHEQSPDAGSEHPGKYSSDSFATVADEWLTLLRTQLKESSTNKIYKYFKQLSSSGF